MLATFGLLLVLKGVSRDSSMGHPAQSGTVGLGSEMNKAGPLRNRSLVRYVT
jgi:hypothetical protein